MDNALTIRGNGCCKAGSVGNGSQNTSGITIRKNSIRKKTPSSDKTIMPHGAGRDSGGVLRVSSSNASAATVSRCGFFSSASIVTRRGLKNDKRSKTFADRTATVAAHSVAKNAVPTITEEKKPQ